jgi:hypothetical protein
VPFRVIESSLCCFKAFFKRPAREWAGIHLHDLEPAIDGALRRLQSTLLPGASSPVSFDLIRGNAWNAALLAHAFKAECPRAVAPGCLDIVYSKDGIEWWVWQSLDPGSTDPGVRSFAQRIDRVLRRRIRALRTDSSIAVAGDVGADEIERALGFFSSQGPVTDQEARRLLLAGVGAVLRDANLALLRH